MRHAVHGEQLVVLLRRQQLRFGPGQLQAHDQRLDAAQDQEDEGGDDVAQADLLVVDAWTASPISPGSVSQIRSSRAPGESPSIADDVGRRERRLAGVLHRKVSR